MYCFRGRANLLGFFCIVLLKTPNQTKPQENLLSTNQLKKPKTIPKLSTPLKLKFAVLGKVLPFPPDVPALVCLPAVAVFTQSSSALSALSENTTQGLFPFQSLAIPHLLIEEMCESSGYHSPAGHCTADYFAVWASSNFSPLQSKIWSISLKICLYQIFLTFNKES